MHPPVDAAPANARRNWLAHAAEGGLFMGGLAFVNAQTLIPSVVQGLGGPEWLVTLVPVLMMVGFQFSPILTAHRIGRLQRFHPLLMTTCAFQRLPYLVAGLVLLACDRPGPALLAVALAPLASGIAGGVSVTAWQQLVARTVEPRRRASLFAVRLVIGSLLGVAAGHVIESTLSAHPGADGYGWLHLWAFAGLVGSYICFALIREPAEPARREPETGLWDNLRSLPGHARDRRVRLFIATSALWALGGAAIPYLAIHARHACALPESFLGELVAWQMAGAIAGNLLAGWAGDRAGGKAVMIASRLGMAALCLLALVAEGPAAWRWLFLLFGAAFNANMVGTGALQLEILPARGRANTLALMGFCSLPAALLAAFAGAGLWSAMSDAAFPWLAGISAAALLLSLAALAPLREPRRAG